MPYGGGGRIPTVYVDGVFVGSLVRDDAYIAIEAEPGEHRVMTADSDGTADSTRYGRNSQSLVIDCPGGQRRFVHHNGRDGAKGGRRFLLEPATVDAMADRKLILTAVTAHDMPDTAPNYAPGVFSRTTTYDVVWEVQLRIKDMGLYDGRIDGGFNAETEAAVREFREQNGLQGDTLLDDHTLTALGIYDD
jgi:hypothetical protein